MRDASKWTPLVVELRWHSGGESRDFCWDMHSDPELLATNLGLASNAEVEENNKLTSKLNLYIDNPGQSRVLLGRRRVCRGKINGKPSGNSWMKVGKTTSQPKKTILAGVVTRINANDLVLTPDERINALPTARTNTKLRDFQLSRRVGRDDVAEEA